MQHFDLQNTPSRVANRTLNIWLIGRFLQGGSAGSSTSAENEMREHLFTGRNILIVEDETMVSMDIAFALQDLGARVLETGTLREALDIAAATPLDAAILDIDLGGRDVFPAADILYARSVPLVFHTGHGDRADLAVQYPDAAVCLKPAMLDALLETLHNAMGQRSDD